MKAGSDRTPAVVNTAPAPRINCSHQSTRLLLVLLMLVSLNVVACYDLLIRKLLRLNRPPLG